MVQAVPVTFLSRSLVAFPAVDLCLRSEEHKKKTKGYFFYQLSLWADAGIQKTQKIIPDIQHFSNKEDS